MVKIFNKNIITTLLFGIFFSTVIYAQERGLILSKYYTPKEYNESPQNWAIAQNKQGVLYFGNNAGVLEYDGSSWRLIRVSNNSTVRALDFDSNNTLYAGAFNELGFFAPNKSGDLSYNSLTHLLDDKHKNLGEIWDVHCFSDSVYFLTDNYIIRYVNNSLKYWENHKKQFYLSYKIGNSYYVQNMGEGLMKLENDSLKLIKQGDFFSDKKIHSILEFDNKLLICTRRNGFYIYNNKDCYSKTIESLSDISEKAKNLNNYFTTNNFYHGIKIDDDRFALSTIFGNTLIIDKNWEVTDVINSDVLGIKSTVQFMYYEKDNSLWLALANGISKVELSSPYRFWNDKCGINGNITDVAQINNKIYVSTGSGVYFTDKKSDNNNFSVSSFYPVDCTFEQAWGLLYFQPPAKSNNKTESNKDRDKNIILITNTNQGLHQIIDNKSKQITNYNEIIKSYQYKKDPSKLILGLTDGVAIINYNNGKWKNLGKQFNINAKIIDIAEDSIGNLWLSANFKGLYRIKKPFASIKDSIAVEFYDTSSGIPSLKSIDFINYKNKILFKSKNNFYYFNDSLKIFNQYSIPTNTTPDTIASEQNSQIDILSEYRIYEDLTSVKYVTSDKDTSFWFGATQGTFRYRNSYKRDLFAIPPVIIRKVNAKDSILFNGTNFTQPCHTNDSSKTICQLDSSSKVDIGTRLKFDYNSITFNYSLPYFECENKNQYSYLLDGYNEKWSEWTTENKKEYTNLPEGKYTFKVKARNLYKIESSIAQFIFVIKPPWYRTVVAYFGYVIAGFLFIILVVKQYTRRLINEKNKLEKLVSERTQEISNQKEELLVQSEHIKDAYEGTKEKNEILNRQKNEIAKQAKMLKKANLELVKLSKVASETDNSIAIFDKDGDIEWINEGFTRMYGYTIDQYIAEKDSNIISSSQNPNIKESIMSCIEDKKSVIYRFETKTRCGKDKWVQTTLTHVAGDEKNSFNLIAIDTDITELVLAEREIQDQRDKLSISNATKTKFFRIIAHDLRNPISTLAGSTNVILNNFEELDREQTKNFIKELNKLSQTTYNLLENLLDWSSTQIGDIAYKPTQIDLLSITRENIELINRKIDQKQIRLKIDIDDNCIAFADENMIKTVVRNLLSNAVKFTPANGCIKLSARCNNQFIHYSVIDSGIGIKEAHIKNLFKVDYHHITPGLDNEKGSGLGLILCKEFIEKNGGNIKINSTINKGTSVVFTLKKYNV